MFSFDPYSPAVDADPFPYYRTLRDEHKFQSGRKITFAPRVFFGAAANPFGLPFEWRAERLAKKVQAGAQFIQTQYCYDVPRLREKAVLSCIKLWDAKAGAAAVFTFALRGEAGIASRALALAIMLAARAFAVIRSEDLIWSRGVKRYFLGREDLPSDLGVWNADTTRMPARMRSAG